MGDQDLLNAGGMKLRGTPTSGPSDLNLQAGASGGIDGKVETVRVQTLRGEGVGVASTSNSKKSRTVSDHSGIFQDPVSLTLRQLKQRRAEAKTTMQRAELAQASHANPKVCVETLDHLITVAEAAEMTVEKMNKKSPEELARIFRSACTLLSQVSKDSLAQKNCRTVLSQFQELPSQRAFGVVQILTQNPNAFNGLPEGDLPEIQAAVCGLVKQVNLQFQQEHSLSAAYVMKLFIDSTHRWLDEGSVTSIQEGINTIVKQKLETLSKNVPRLLSLKDRQGYFEDISLLAKMVMPDQATQLHNVFMGLGPLILIWPQYLRDSYRKAQVALASCSRPSDRLIRTESLLHHRQALKLQIGQLGRFLHTIGFGFLLFTPEKVLQAGTAVVEKVEAAVTELENQDATSEERALLQHELQELDHNPVFRAILAASSVLRQKYQASKAKFTRTAVFRTVPLAIEKQIQMECARARSDTPPKTEPEIQAITKKYRDAKKPILEYLEGNYDEMTQLAEKSPVGAVSISKSTSKAPYTLRCLKDKTTGMVSFHLSFGLLAEGSEAVIKTYVDLVTGEMGAKRSAKEKGDLQQRAQMAEQIKMVQRLIADGVTGLVEPTFRLVLSQKKGVVQSSSTAELYQGDLFAYVQAIIDDKVKPSPDELARIAKDLSRTVIQMHRCGVVHRDIKLENVLLTADKAPHLADFGLATDIGAKGAISGSPGYVAPELIQQLLLGGGQARSYPQHDLWSLGVLLYTLMSCDPALVEAQNAFFDLINGPSEAVTQKKLDESVASFEASLADVRKKLLGQPPSIPMPWCSIIAALLDPNPIERINDDGLEREMDALDGT